MNDKFEQLKKLGAGEFEHIDGSLIDHLNGTKQLLKQWGASAELQDAGLYHAAYGTAGFDENLVSTDQRNQIAAIIGSEAEEIVYQYCACDRNDFFSKIAQGLEPEFNNRFTGDSYFLADTMLRNFCELTVANEIEIAIDNSDFVDQHGAGLHYLFVKMTPYLSNAAREKAAEAFGSAANQT